MHECPKCGVLMAHQDAEPDVNIVGAWICVACDYSELDDEGEYEPDDHL
jgi:ribosomal protein S27AE